MLNQPCFTCGAPASRRVEVEVAESRISRRGQLSDTVRHYEPRLLCDGCIAERERAQQQALAVVGPAIAVAGGTALVGILITIAIGVIGFLGMAALIFYFVLR